VISERDNVATALEALERGRRLLIGRADVTVLEPIPPGHKVALTAIEQGQPVTKYGSPIGLATVDIPAGAHVHTHNVASSRGRGDLDAPISAAEPRLAEPSDEDAAGEPSAAEPKPGHPR
jgi:altronate hydrolase